MEETNWPSWYCPIHREPLKYKGDILICPCGDCYPIKNQIPRFVSDINYADSFGLEWSCYRRTQLDSYTGCPISRNRMRRCISEDLWNKLDHKHILECGCGAGRFTEIFLAKGAYVTSIDLSKAVDANQENFPQSETHRIAQSDILQLPFLPQQYDIVFCLGVIQHTPRPRKTLSSLYNQVKPGGTLVIDHYTYNLSFFTKTAPLLRFFFRRMPPTKCMRMIEKLVDILFPLHKMVKRFYPIQAILSRISPIRTYYHAFSELDDELQKEWALLDTYDSLTPRYQHLRSLQFIRKKLMELGLEKIWCSRGGNGVEARGRRPLVL